MEAESGFCDADDVTDAATDDVTDAATDDVTDAATDDVTDAPTDDVTDAPTNDVTDAPSDDVTDAPSDDGICDTYASDPGATIHENDEDLEVDDMSVPASLPAQEENDQEGVSNNLLGDDGDTSNAETTIHDNVRDDSVGEDEGPVATSQQTSGVEADASCNPQHSNEGNVNKRIPKNVQETLRMAQSWYGDLSHDEGRTLRKRQNPTSVPSGTAKKQRN